MESKMLGFCSIAAVLGIIAAATGFAGETTRPTKCDYKSSPALALGITSAVFTIIARIYMSVSFGGPGCCQSDPNSTPITKLLFVLSWVASVIGVIFLVVAASLSVEARVEDVDLESNYVSCYIMNPGLFATGAITALLSVVFGIIAYISTPQPQTTTEPPKVASSMGTNVDPEKNVHMTTTPPPQTSTNPPPVTVTPSPQTTTKVAFPVGPTANPSKSQVPSTPQE